MNTLGRCPHCGAPITTQIVLSGRIAVCEYCRSEFLLDDNVYNAINKYHQEQKRKAEAKEYILRQKEIAQNQLAMEMDRIRREKEYEAEELRLKRIKEEKAQMVKAHFRSIRRTLAIISTCCFLGLFGIPSLLCKRYGLFGITWLIITILANCFPTLGISYVILFVVCGFIIPIISIKNIK